MNDIVFWRHAEAHDAEFDQVDLDRKLTVKGQRNAERVAHWLDRNLPQQCRVFASEAKRAQQTARCLPRKFKTLAQINPDAGAADVLSAVGWGEHAELTLVVGHQPWMGHCVAQLLGLGPRDWSIKKGAVWWLQRHGKGEGDAVIVRAVISPDLT
ncbi:MAG: histidine phosphatase family protein [Betaproteobacteria bacterium]|nr:MAG: histidine phosphatase family protein [Betaproteobacteria bacterium]TAG76939.1 MAG: histidine phosphatase family protein [Betaproteobacteria bacterium]